MVTLINIKKTNDILKADYIAEGNSDDVGYIEYDVAKNEVIKFRYNKTDETSHFQPYFHKVITAIKEMIKNNNYPDTYTYMWY